LMICISVTEFDRSREEEEVIIYLEEDEDAHVQGWPHQH